MLIFGTQIDNPNIRKSKQNTFWDEQPKYENNFLAVSVEENIKVIPV